MKAHLMFRQQDFDIAAKEPAEAAALVQDLELAVLFEAMGASDAFLLKVARGAILGSLQSVEAIQYRQAALRDCLQSPLVMREVYSLTVEALERERKVWGWSSRRRHPDSSLHRSVEVLKIFVLLLRKLRGIAEQQADKFRSEAFTELWAMPVRELSDSYLQEVQTHLQHLTFRTGLTMTAQLGAWNCGCNYVLNRSPEVPANWLERVHEWMQATFGAQEEHYSYEVAPRDEAGAQALAELRNRGIDRVAAALERSTAHILSFFEMLRLELAFYVGALNLHERLTKKGESICIPEPRPMPETTLVGRGLYDVCLSLSVRDPLVPNDIDAENKQLAIIIGANRGGKSTFLRAVGQAQLMMQCGLFVGAQQWRANLCSGLFTHYKRQEDASMKSGKLDEELSRMQRIVREIKPRGLVLLNEAFGSTNEREGSEIAQGIVRALIERDIKVFYVTHLFHLAWSFWLDDREEALFLRAEREVNGTRTFRLIEGQPLSTSFGGDLYQRVFGAPLEA